MSRIIPCPACGARNTTAGRCVHCDAPLGSIRRAIHAAIISSAVLAAAWVGIGLLLGMELTFIAVGYGAAVSFATVHFSNGMGPMYQLVATSATILGILVADITLMASFHSPDGLATVGTWDTMYWIEVMGYFLTWDPFTWLFLMAGVMGGFYIWRYS